MSKFKKVEVNDNNRAIAYYRYSSAGQNDASIEQQKNVAEKFAREKGLIIIKEYQDAAMSGLDDDRPGFQSMLSEIKSLNVNSLILWKTDRLSRDTCNYYARLI